MCTQAAAMQGGSDAEVCGSCAVKKKMEWIFYFIFYFISDNSPSQKWKRSHSKHFYISTSAAALNKTLFCSLCMRITQ